MKRASVEVAIRIRPMRNDLQESNLCWDIHKKQIAEKGQDVHQFTFDRIYGMDSQTEDIYEKSVRDSIVKGVADGYNGTVFAYGQTGSGKSYTMLGLNAEGSHCGIVAMAVNDLFLALEKEKQKGYTVNVFVGMLEIYNETLRDLLVSDESAAPTLSIRENEHGVYVHNAQKRPITNAKACLDAIHTEAEERRTTAATSMNPQSSRSHCLIRVLVEKTMNYTARDSDSDDEGDGSLQKKVVSTLNLVDLAGSERVAKTHATGQRLAEGGAINKSLMALTTVIKKLTDKDVKKGAFIPYRDSKLTQLLKTALGGNSFTTVFCCMSGADQHVDESRSTLQFASRAKAIKNEVQLNEVADSKTKIRELETSLKKEKALAVAMQLYLWSKDLKIKNLGGGSGGSGGGAGGGSAAEMEAMQTLVTQLTAQVEDLQSQLMDAQTAAANSVTVQGGGHVDPTMGFADDSEKNALRGEVEDLTQRVVELEAENEAFLENAAELEDLCDELGKEADEKDTAIADLKKFTKDLEADVARYNLEVTSMELSMNQMREQRKSEEKVLIERSRGDSLLEQMTKLQVEHNALQVENSTIMDMYSRTEIEKAKEISMLTDELQELKEFTVNDHEEARQYKSWLWRLMSVATHTTQGKPPDSAEVGGTIREQQVEAAIRQLNAFVSSRASKAPNVTPTRHDDHQDEPQTPSQRSTLNASSSGGGGGGGGAADPQLLARVKELETKIQQKDAQRDILIDTKLKRMQELVMRLHTSNIYLKNEVVECTKTNRQLHDLVKSDPELGRYARKQGIPDYDADEIQRKAAYAVVPNRPAGHN